MQKIVYTLFLISLVFLGNIGLYFSSDAYSSFLKKLKYGEEYTGEYSDLITDEYTLGKKDRESLACNCPQDTIGLSGGTIETGIQNFPETSNFSGSQIQSVDPLSKVQKQRLERSKIAKVMRYFSSYDFTEQMYDEYYQIFGISDEYPQLYYTFIDGENEIYFFPDSSFEDMYELFEVFREQLVNEIEIKRLDNFGKSSFFINQINSPDSFVRIVIDTGDIVMGIKIKKDSYTNIKQILQNF